MLKGRSWFYGDKIEERRLNDCVTSLRHHNDVRSLTTNSIIDRHYFSSVSFRTLVLEQQWSNACNILPSLLFFSHFYSYIFSANVREEYILTIGTSVCIFHNNVVLSNYPLITFIWYWIYVIFPLCFSGILRN